MFAHAVKLFKDEAGVLGVNAHTAISHYNFHGFGAVALFVGGQVVTVHINAAAIRRELNGIANELSERLHQALQVGFMKLGGLPRRSGQFFRTSS